MPSPIKALIPKVLSVLVAALAGPSALQAAPTFKYWDVGDPSKAPATLSASGLYKDIAARKKILTDGAALYEVNSALWSDDAKKKRWVLLKPGTSIGFRETDDYWDYPDSAVFIKDFAIDTITGDSASRVLWETRLLINKKEISDSATGTRKDRWYGFSYKWDADQKEARLVAKDGLASEIRVWPHGRTKPSRMKKWVFPARGQCLGCHANGSVDVQGRTVLGFFTAQLNRPHPDTVDRNQLDILFASGILKGPRPSNWRASPRWRAIEDDKASLDVRARSYIAANCSGCHGERGLPATGMMGNDINYDFHAMRPAMELRNKSASARGLDTLLPRFYPRNDPGNPEKLDSLEIVPAVIVAGYPEKSLLLFRQWSRNTDSGNFDAILNQMPPLATFEVNERATELIERWIREMPPLPPVGLGPHAARGLRAKPEAVFQGRTLSVSREALRGDPRVSMVSVDGREVRLERISEGLYAVPASLPKGLYLIRIGGKSLLRSLL